MSTVSRWQCTGCQECIQYMPDRNTPGECLCGHSEIAHKAAPLVVPFSLPPKGGCPSTGCLKFIATEQKIDAPGHTICQSPGCGRPYISHLNPVSAPPQTATVPLPGSVPWGLVPSSFAPGTAWSHSRPTTFETTNDRRVSKANLHRTPGPVERSAFGPLSGSSAPCTSRRGYPSYSDKGKGKQVQVEPTTVNLTIAIYPYPMYQEGLPDDCPREHRIDDNRALRFCLSLSQSGLLFTVPLDATPTKQVWCDLEKAVNRQCQTWGLTFPIDPQPLVVPDTYSKDAVDYNQLPWQFCELGSKPRAGVTGRIVKVKALAHYMVTTQTLQRIASIDNPSDSSSGAIVIISPKHGNLRGPVQIRGQKQHLHPCFPLRILRTLENDDIEEIECMDSCPQESGVPLVPEPSGIVTTQDGGLFFSDSEDEASTSDFQLAVKRSLEDSRKRPSATPDSAGPSYSSSVWNHDSETTMGSGTEIISGQMNERPRTRQRTDNYSGSEEAPIIIWDIPSPTTSYTGNTVLRRSLTVNSWSRLVDSKIHSEKVKFTSPTSEAMVIELYAYIGRLFGGTTQPNPAVTIVLTQDGSILSSKRSWHVGEGFGSGVEKTVISGLITYILKQGSIWKRIGDTHVISLEPSIVPPTPERLHHLKIAGFACLLFILWTKAIPPEISPIFILAMMAGDGSIVDIEFVRQFDSAMADTLSPWPLHHHETFDPRAPEIATLICNFLERQPADLKAVPKAAYTAYTQYLFGKVLLDADRPYSSSSDAEAFMQGLNYPLSMDFNLVKSMGTDMKTLISQMNALKIKSPQDVLDAIQWKSTGVNELMVYETKWKEAFARYLFGTGVISHTSIDSDQMTEAELGVDPQDHLYRGEQFLEQVTGVKLLPRDNAKIVVEFWENLPEDQRIQRPLNAPLDWQPELAPFKISSCFRTIHTPIPQTIQDLLDQPIPSNPQTPSHFCLYFYTGARLAAEYDEFNQP